MRSLLNPRGVCGVKVKLRSEARRSLGSLRLCALVLGALPLNGIRFIFGPLRLGLSCHFSAFSVALGLGRIGCSTDS